LLTWSDYIKAETLSTDLVDGEPPDDAHQETHTLDGEKLLLGVKRQG